MRVACRHAAFTTLSATFNLIYRELRPCSETVFTMSFFKYIFLMLSLILQITHMSPLERSSTHRIREPCIGTTVRNTFAEYVVFYYYIQG